MRRILVEDARSRLTLKRGGGKQPVRLDEAFVASEDRLEEIIAVHDALATLEEHDANAAKLVKLRQSALTRAFPLRTKRLVKSTNCR